MLLRQKISLDKQKISVPRWKFNFMGHHTNYIDFVISIKQLPAF